MKLVYGSHWALAYLLYWYGRLTGRTVGSMVGSNADGRFGRTYENSYPSARSLPSCRAPRSMARPSRGRVGRWDVTWQELRTFSTDWSLLLRHVVAWLYDRPVHWVPRAADDVRCLGMRQQVGKMMRCCTWQKLSFSVIFAADSDNQMLWFLSC